jgi:hypothetical protein
VINILALANVLQDMLFLKMNALEDAHLLKDIFSTILVTKLVHLTTNISRLMVIITDALQHAHHRNFFLMIRFALLLVHL